MRCLFGKKLCLTLLAAVALSGCAGPRPDNCDKNCQAEQRRDAYLASHPDLPPKTRSAIALGRVLVGMSADEVIAVLGEPDSKVDAHAPWIEREQWIYRSAGGMPSYYVFRFGRLHTWTGDSTAQNE